MAPTRSAAAESRVDSILAKQIAAAGGRGVLEKVKTRTMRGKIELVTFSMTTDWEMCAKAPNRQWSSAQTPGVGAAVEAFDGKTAWAKSPTGELREKSGPELAMAKRQADFYRDLRMKELYPDLAYKGPEQLDGEEVEVLGSAGAQERFSYSKKTGLLVRQQWELEVSGTKLAMDMRFRDFKSIDGIQCPERLVCQLRTGEQDIEFVIHIVEVKHNLPIEDARFAKPAS